MPYGDNENKFKQRQRRRFPQHACELPFSPDRIHRALPPLANIGQRFKFWWRIQIEAWRENPCLRIFRHSNYAIEMEQSVHYHSTHWWLIHPFSRFWTYWQLVVIFGTTIYLFTFPYLMAFILMGRLLLSHEQYQIITQDPEELKKFGAYAQRVRRNLEIIMRIGDGVYCIHMILMFITGYYVFQTNVVVMKISFILIRYVKGWFLWDLISIVPTEIEQLNLVYRTYEYLIDYDILGNRISMYAFTFLYSLRLIRLHHVISYIKNWCRVLGVNYIICKFIIMAYGYLLYIQWSTYFFVRIPYLVRGSKLARNNSISWLSDPVFKFFPIGRKGMFEDQYIKTVYRVIKARGFISSGTLLPSMTEEDAIVFFVVMWFGSCISVTALAVLLHYIESNESSYESLAKLFGNLKMYKMQRKIPPNLNQRIDMFYRQKFLNNYYNEKAFIRTLTENIRLGLKISICRKVVTGSMLFKSIPKSLMCSIAANLVEELYLPHDVIYCCGSEATYLYFLSIGTVAVYLRTGEEVGHLMDGDVIGAMGIVLEEHNLARVETVVALEVCQTYKIHRQTFSSLVTRFPRLHARIRASAMEQAEDVTATYYDELYNPPWRLSSSETTHRIYTSRRRSSNRQFLKESSSSSLEDEEIPKRRSSTISIKLSESETSP